MKIINNLGAPHIESFNYMLREGLNDCVKNMKPIQFELPNSDRVKLAISNIGIQTPAVPHTVIGVKDRRVYPTECRQRASTYNGMLIVRLQWSVNGLEMPSHESELGEIPIMLKSNACNLNGLNPKQLVEKGEHENEWGGYFVVKGNEKLIRMLLMTRKNYPMTVKRSTWKDRGSHFSDIGVLIRTVKSDQTATVIGLFTL